MGETDLHGGNRAADAQASFRSRMEAQCSEIERYRQAVLRHQGRALSRDEAALEWIRCYADDFAQPDP